MHVTIEKIDVTLAKPTKVLCQYSGCTSFVSAPSAGWTTDTFRVNTPGDFRSTQRERRGGRAT